MGSQGDFTLNMFKRYFQAETAARCTQASSSVEMMRYLEVVRNQFPKSQRIGVRSEEMKRCLEIVKVHFAEPQTVGIGATKVIEEGGDFWSRLV